MKNSRLISLNKQVAIDFPKNDEVNKIKAFQTQFDLNQNHLPLYPQKHKVRLTTKSFKVLALKEFLS